MELKNWWLQRTTPELPNETPVSLHGLTAKAENGRIEESKNRRRRITLQGWRDAGLRLPEAGVRARR